MFASWVPLYVLPPFCPSSTIWSSFTPSRHAFCYLLSCYFVMLIVVCCVHGLLISLSLFTSSMHCTSSLRSLRSGFFPLFTLARRLCSPYGLLSSLLPHSCRQVAPFPPSSVTVRVERRHTSHRHVTPSHKLPQLCYFSLPFSRISFRRLFLLVTRWWVGHDIFLPTATSVSFNASLSPKTWKKE